MLCFHFILVSSLLSISGQLLSNACEGAQCRADTEWCLCIWVIFSTMWSPEAPLHPQSLGAITFLHRRLHFCSYCLVFGKSDTDNSSVSLIPFTQATLKHDCYSSHWVSLILFEHWCSCLLNHLVGSHFKASSSYHTGSWKELLSYVLSFLRYGHAM